ncbi:MAG: PD40 domain-containing protein, partial [Myxococcales bacterium]|nr:PD40 domain-containing protein [Myxococcales bacterium]
LPPGDFDPKISPDGQWLASYRKRDNSLVVEIGGEIIVVGDFDLWVAPVSHPLQPAAESITLLNVDNQVIDMMPRWDQSGTRLAFWSVDFHGVADPADIVVVELALPADPLDPPVVVNRTDVTDGYFAEGRYWSETMPTWDPDPARPDGLLFSATGKLP